MMIDKYAILGYITVPCSIAFTFGLSFSYASDSWTVLSIFLSSIGIGLAIAIFAIQQTQNQKLNELSLEQQELVQKITDIITQQDENKNSRLQVNIPRIIRQLKQSKKNYESLIHISEHPKMREIIEAIHLILDNKGPFTNLLLPQYGIRSVTITHNDDEKYFRNLFEKIEFDIDSKMIENTLALQEWAYDHFMFLINNKDHPKEIASKFSSEEFQMQNNYFEYLIKYFENLISNTSS